MFYKYTQPPLSLSKFLRLEEQKQHNMLQLLREHKLHAQILSFCFMTNHFHLLIKQTADKGIARFLSNFQNSYTRYFNTRHERDGALFLDQFKAVRIETDEQLLHVSRYIHLNPYTGYVIKSKLDLDKYRWSSFPNYLDGDNKIVETNFLLGFFRSVNDFKQFVLDQADYQRSLKEIVHLIIE